MILRAGDTIDAYRVLGTLGSGGSGSVYRAEHTITGRVEAMKVLHRGYLESPEEEQRFLREIRLHAVLNHPNIVAVHNALRIGDDLVMIMEFVEGQSLAAILEQGRLPLLETLDLVGQALTALEFAHAYEITHRDITPSNFIVTPDGLLKLMDFGLALQQTAPRLTQTGAAVGSYAYMSPEQVRAEALDLRTDIYSVGAVLFELLTGRPPFVCDSAYALMRAHTQEDPPAPSKLEPGLPPEIDRLVLKALEKDPALRYRSASEFREALQRTTAAIANRPAARAAPPPPPPGLSPTVKFVMMLAATFAIFIVVGIVSIYTSSPAGHAASPAAAPPIASGSLSTDAPDPATVDLPVFEPPPFAAAGVKPKPGEENPVDPSARRTARKSPAKR
ncbi:MAG: serine/threonine-protein kinase [Bryobacteraceae bacterium]